MSESKNAADGRKGTGSGSAERGQNIARNALQCRLLFRSRLVNQKLVYARLGIAADHVPEGLGGGPWIGGHHGSPAVQRTDNRRWIAAYLCALLVEDGVALAHFLDGPEGIPRVGVLGHDAQHLRLVRRQDQRWARLLDGSWPHRGCLELVA